MTAVDSRSGLDPDRQIEWAAKIARHLASENGLRGSRVDDVVQEALYMVARLLKRFNRKRCPPGGNLEGLFRAGFSYRAIRTACIDEIKRDRGGGLIRRRRRRPVICESLGELAPMLPSRAAAQLDGEEPGEETSLSAEQLKLEAENRLRTVIVWLKKRRFILVKDRNGECRLLADRTVPGLITWPKWFEGFSFYREPLDQAERLRRQRRRRRRLVKWLRDRYALVRDCRGESRVVSLDQFDAETFGVPVSWLRWLRRNRP